MREKKKKGKTGQEEEIGKHIEARWRLRRTYSSKTTEKDQPSQKTEILYEKTKHKDRTSIYKHNSHQKYNL